MSQPARRGWGQRGKEARAASFLGQRDLFLLVTAPLYLSALSTPSCGLGEDREGR
jgi:hypothetical protein